MSFDTDQSSYQDFRSILAERTNQVVAWIGAGLSIPTGLPSWPTLKDDLCRALEIKVRTLSPEDRARADGQLKWASNEKNFWIAFKILKEALGRTSYRDCIRSTLKPAETASIPSTYEHLWKLGVTGILNLNLDRLAARSHSIVRSGKYLNEFCGKDAAASMHLLSAPSPFVANLHGIADNLNSWVFTQDELKMLMNSPGYKEFIQTCLSSRTVVFLGISADDIAAGGHLARLTDEGIDVGTHFWVTDRCDSATDQWAETAGMRPIRYQNADGRHTELDELFDDLLNYIPQDDEVIPVAPEMPERMVADALPDPIELQKEDAEDIREQLNAHARAILNTDKAEKYNEYNDFCARYDEAIYRAWYVAASPPGNRVLGYTLDEKVAEGAFGTVYRARDKDGDCVAIKVLHQEIRNKPEMLQGFRRGVRSMNILSNRGINGVVRYRNASEIPAFAVMDFIEGLDLKQAVIKRQIKNWITVLRVARDLTSIIRSSHQLPERVLHRDIRPPNIIIRDCWSNEEDWEVVVLDFDLSWHRDAHEVSVLQPETMSGYLAPEQVIRDPSSSTRNAAVDSFGLGMTLFFLRTARDPSFLQHRHHDWNEELSECASQHTFERWKSLPNRYFRLVSFATQDNQAQRWDVTQVKGELDRLFDAATNPTEVRSAEFLAEELASRGFVQKYKWNADKLAGCVELPTGLSATIEGREADREVAIRLSWQDPTGRFKDVKKWVPNAHSKVIAMLKKGGWEVEGESHGVKDLNVEAIIKVDMLRSNLETAAEFVGKVMAQLDFK